MLPPLAQVALEEGETVARNLDAELEGRPLEAFTFHDKGFVVSVGTLLLPKNSSMLVGAIVRAEPSRRCTR